MITKRYYNVRTLQAWNGCSRGHCWSAIEFLSMNLLRLLERQADRCSERRLSNGIIFSVCFVKWGNGYWVVCFIEICIDDRKISSVHIGYCFLFVEYRTHWKRFTWFAMSTMSDRNGYWWKELEKWLIVFEKDQYSTSFKSNGKSFTIGFSTICIWYAHQGSVNVIFDMMKKDSQMKTTGIAFHDQWELWSSSFSLRLVLEIREWLSTMSNLKKGREFIHWVCYENVSCRFLNTRLHYNLSCLVEVLVFHRVDGMMNADLLYYYLCSSLLLVTWMIDNKYDNIAWW